MYVRAHTLARVGGRREGTAESRLFRERTRDLSRCFYKNLL